MAEFREQFEAAGLRRVHVKLPRGDVQIGRIEGNAVVIEADEPILVERGEAVLEIRAGKRGEETRGRKRERKEFNHQPGNLGAYINEVVSEAVDGIFAGGFAFGFGQGADVRIGIPAMLERPLVEVHTGAGDIEVETLTAELSLRSDRGDITVRGAGGALQMITGSGDLEIQAFVGPVKVQTGVGEVTVADCTEGGTIHSGSGEIEAHGLTGAWELRTGSGDVEVVARGEASLAIATGSGDIEVTGGTLHRLEVQSGSGDVQCKSLLLGPRHRLVTGHGDIEVAIANPPGARLMINTTHGEVESAYPLVKVGKQGPQSHGGARFVGNIGDSGIDIELRTGSGDIEISRLDLDEEALRVATQARNRAGTREGSTMERSPEAEQAARDAEQALRDAEQAARDAHQARLEVHRARLDAVRAHDEAMRAGADPSHFPPPPVPPMAPIPPIPPIHPIPPIAPAFPDTPAPLKSERTAAETKDDPEETPAAGQAAPANPRLAVLESLGRGEISVEEAARLLESLRAAVG